MSAGQVRVDRKKQFNADSVRRKRAQMTQRIKPRITRISNFRFQNFSFLDFASLPLSPFRRKLFRRANRIRER
jgi:hypothetical protein